MKRHIVAVVVLYKTSFEQSASCQSLLRAMEQVPDSELALLLLVQDNTPGAVPPNDLPHNAQFFAESSNTGLAGAYNRALDIGIDQGYEWLLTLDQDTDLPQNFLQGLLDVLAHVEDQPEVGAVAPQIRAGSRIVSPNYFAAGAWPRWFPARYTGVPDRTVFAFNSGSLLRISALRQAGGYSPWFWLDNSDAAMYRALSKFGKRVYVAGNLEILHDFSMMNLQQKVSPERYRTLLLADSAFWDLEMSGPAGLERTIRLLGRTLKHIMRGDDAVLRRLTLQQLFRRIFWTRKRRIALWRNATASHLDNNLESWHRPGRALISVCMASYNGGSFIEAQLRSILPQLGVGDEIVVVDDASRDDSPAIILRLQQELLQNPKAPKLIFVRQQPNRGVVRTFERALRIATGDLLFLCDDDDRWAPNKVHKFCEAFAADPATMVVCSKVAIIDEQDRPVLASDFLKHRRFTSGLLANFVHNQFQGSAMAFRASLLAQVLPFPVNRLFLHDAWIGARNTLTGGRSHYIDEPLLLYRRHTGNFSRRLSLWKQVRLRVELLMEHLLQARSRL